MVILVHLHHVCSKAAPAFPWQYSRALSQVPGVRMSVCPIEIEIAMGRDVPQVYHKVLFLSLFLFRRQGLALRSSKKHFIFFPSSLFLGFVCCTLLCLRNILSLAGPGGRTGTRIAQELACMKSRRDGATPPTDGALGGYLLFFC